MNRSTLIPCLLLLWPTAALGQAAPVTTHTAHDTFPDWSADGSKVVFSSQRGGADDIWIITLSSGQIDQVTTHASPDFEPAWSPDGSQIVFTSLRSGNEDIWVIPSTGGTATQITSHAADDVSPDWSPDGTTLVFTSTRSGNRDVWAVPATGGTPVQLTTNASVDQFPKYSPDGTMIAFDSNRGGLLGRIWVMEADGDAQTLVTTEPGLPGTGIAPAWSTSDVLAYHASDGIYQIPASGGQRSLILSVGTYTPAFVDWSPDGTEVVFASVNPSGNQDVYRVDVSSLPTRPTSWSRLKAGF